MRIIKYLVRLCISLFIVGFFVWRIDWRSIMTLLASTRLSLLLFAVIPLSLNVVIATIRWHWLLQPLNADFRFLDILRLRLVAEFFNVCLPGGFAGDVLRGVQSKRFGVTLGESFSSVFTDRLIGMIGLVVISVVGIMFSWKFLLQTEFIFYVIGFSFTLLFLSILIYSRPVRSKFSAITPLFGRFGARLDRFYHAVQQYWNFPGILFKVFGITVLGHMFMTVSIYLLALSLHADISFTYFLLFVPVIGILSMIPITVNGLGLREAGYVLLFPLVGMSQAQALGTSLLFFVIIVGRSFIGGVLYLLPEGV
jgi:uncharacterized protein (TIRG00374 family)